MVVSGPGALGASSRARRVDLLSILSELVEEVGVGPAEIDDAFGPPARQPDFADGHLLVCQRPKQPSGVILVVVGADNDVEVAGLLVKEERDDPRVRLAAVHEEEVFRTPEEERIPLPDRQRCEPGHHPRKNNSVGDSTTWAE